ncbi:MAG: IS110 family transposase, partial [bacterium]
SVQVAVMDSAGRELGNHRCPNSVTQVIHTIERYGGSASLAIESCGGAAEFAEALMRRTGWVVNLAHPGFVRRMKQNPDKSDYTDSLMLADLERVGYLPRVWLAPEPIRQLRALLNYRQQQVNQIRAAKLRIRAVLRERRLTCPTDHRPWRVGWVAWLRQTEALDEHTRWILDRHLHRIEDLEREKRAVEQRLERVTRDDPVVQRLRRMAGIGPVTAWSLRAVVGRFDRFRTGKQLARYCGLSPRNASSGERRADAGTIKAGNPMLRGVLAEAAHRLMRFDPRWRSLAGRMRRGGKPTNVIVMAVANRWLRWLYHQMPAGLGPVGEVPAVA